MKNKKNKF